MAEIVISGLIKFVCEKVASKALREFGLLTNIDKELRKLESTLSTIQDVLEDAEARQAKEKALKGWLKKLRDVAFDADDLLDDVAAKAIKWRPEIEGHMKKKVSNLFSNPKVLPFRYKLCRKLEGIMERLDEIAGERSKFHLKEGAVAEWKGEGGEREETGSFVNESEVFGRHDDREKMVYFLTNVSSNDHPDVIPIVGLGGLGKTTVAQLAYNDDRVCKHFEKRIWVCVSDDFEIRRIIRSIIESASNKECRLKSIDSMQQSLVRLLREKKFLLVLDDVWNENQEKWDRLRILLSSGASGSRVLVTTRSERVASIMGTVAPHFLTVLSDDVCWALFEKRAFGLDAAAKTPHLVAIGKQIVKKCGGLPLAAKALGSLLRFKRRESEWLAVKDSEIWKLPDDENEILPALMLSYNHLPSRLKPCFAYCSVFPKDYEIRKEALVRLWMAEGFIRPTTVSAHFEDVGHRYVEELLARSLFQNGSEDTDGVVRQVKMHDLVHDLARFVAGDECSIVDAGNGEALSQSSRYSSFICDGKLSSILETLHEAKKLRTFYLVGSERTVIEEPDEKASEVLTAMFSSLKLLRALHLRRYPMKELPVLVRKLRHLRYLDLSGTHLEVLPGCISLLQNLQTLSLACCKVLGALPDSIGELYNLSTLDLEGCKRLVLLPNSLGRLRSLQKLNLSLCEFIQTLPESMSDLSNLQVLELRHCYSITKLPKNMGNLRNLIHLDIGSCTSLTCMPEGIGELSHLRTLPMFVLGGKSNCNIRELGHLNLEGRLHIRNLENVKNAANVKEAKLKEKQSLRSISLSWNFRAGNDIERALEEAGEESLRNLIIAFLSQDLDADEEVHAVLEGLQPHASVEVLEIEEYIAPAFPRWMMDLSSYPNLVELRLTSCIRCRYLPALGQLPCLKVLSLSRLWAIVCLGSEFYGGDSAFPALEELQLSHMLLLVGWSGTSEREIFPRLGKLRLVGCPNLRALPSAFPTVRELTMAVDDELLLSALASGAFPNLDNLSILNCDEDEEELPEVITRRLDSIGICIRRCKPRAIHHDPLLMSITSKFQLAITRGMNGVSL